MILPEHRLQGQTSLGASIIHISYEPDGNLLVQPPRFHQLDDFWLPAVVLPLELAKVVAVEAPEAFGTCSLNDQSEATR
jgi:hypothetical protein